MEPLHTLFTPLVARVNRTLAETTPARELAAELDGRCFVVRLLNSALALSVRVEEGQLEVQTSIPDEPDVAIEGPLSGIVRLMVAGGDLTSLRDVGVTISGQADLAQKFQRLFTLARPDPEEELAGVIGDAAARQVNNAVKDVADWGRRSGSIMAANIREYLQEETRDVPSPYEMERFRREVQTLRDDVDRAAVRLRRIEKRRT